MGKLAARAGIQLEQEAVRVRVRPTPRKAENKGDGNEDIFPDITLVCKEARRVEPWQPYTNTLNSQLEGYGMRVDCGKYRGYRILWQLHSLTYWIL